MSRSPPGRSTRTSGTSGRQHRQDRKKEQAQAGRERSASVDTLADTWTPSPQQPTEKDARIWKLSRRREDSHQLDSFFFLDEQVDRQQTYPYRRRQLAEQQQLELTPSQPLASRGRSVAVGRSGTDRDAPPQEAPPAAASHRHQPQRHAPHRHPPPPPTSAGVPHEDEATLRELLIRWKKVGSVVSEPRRSTNVDDDDDDRDAGSQIVRLTGGRSFRRVRGYLECPL
nr:unnamed protein product [Callosobruchus chinensis]